MFFTTSNIKESIISIQNFNEILFEGSYTFYKIIIRVLTKIFAVQQNESILLKLHDLFYIIKDAARWATEFPE